MRLPASKSIRGRIVALALSASLLASCGAARIEAARVLSASPAETTAPRHPTPKPRCGPDCLAWVRAVMFSRWIEAVIAYETTEATLCGGDLPPCYVMWRESKGNPWAVNPGHMGAPYGDPGDPWTHASGKWQFLPSSWNNFAGYPYAAAAPASVQNQAARQLWANGAGASHWACC